MAAGIILVVEEGDERATPARFRCGHGPPLRRRRVAEETAEGAILSEESPVLFRVLHRLGLMAVQHGAPWAGQSGPPIRRLSGAPPDLRTRREPPLQRYLPGLDGMRALAVIAVVVFHSALGIAPGGLPRGRGLLRHQRLHHHEGAAGRARGAAGASHWGASGCGGRDGSCRRCSCCWSRVAAYTVIVEPGEAAGLRRDILAALAYVTNWDLIVAGETYFDSWERPSLLLRHLWSLAVEEQFYVVWPLLMAGSLALLRNRLTLALILGGAAASAIAMAALYEPGSAVTRIYYGTDTRASGLLIGSALAFVWSARQSEGGSGLRALAGSVDADARGACGPCRARGLHTPDGRGLAAPVPGRPSADGGRGHGGLDRGSHARALPPREGAGSAGAALGGAAFVRHLPVALAGDGADAAGGRAARRRIAVRNPGGDHAVAGGGVVPLGGASGSRGGAGAAVEPAEGGRRHTAVAMAGAGVHGRRDGGGGGSARGVHDAGAGSRGSSLLRTRGACASRTSQTHTSTSLRQEPMRMRPRYPWGRRPPGPSAAPETPRGFASTAATDDQVALAIATPPGGTARTEQAASVEALTTRFETELLTFSHRDSASAGAGSVRVTAIGDSVMLGAAHELAAQVPGIDLDAAVGRQVSQAIRLLEERKANGQLGDIVLLHLGNNGAFSAKQFDRIMEVVGAGAARGVPDAQGGPLVGSRQQRGAPAGRRPPPTRIPRRLAGSAGEVSPGCCGMMAPTCGPNGPASTSRCCRGILRL